MIKFAALTQVGARELARKTASKIAKRSARLQDKGIYTQAAKKFDQLREGPKPKTRNQWVAYARKLTELDQSPGLRAESAPVIYRREEAAAHRKQHRSRLMSKVQNPLERRRMTDAELREATALQRKNLVAARNRVLKATGRPNHATKRLDDLLEEIDGKRKANKGKLTHQQLASFASRMQKISEFEGVTVKGAKEQEQRGRDLFGNAYVKMDDDDRAAVWEAVHKKVRDDHSVGSGEALAEVKAMMNDQDITVTFTGGGVDPKTGRPEPRVATFGGTDAEAKARQAREEHTREKIAEYLRDYRQTEDPDSDDGGLWM